MYPIVSIFIEILLLIYGPIVAERLNLLFSYLLVVVVGNREEVALPYDMTVLSCDTL